jgi:uncharacterized protein YndB with AHSA1/START domain
VVPLPAGASAGVSERVELQAEIDAPRRALFDLLATSDGLRRWLDEAELDARVGGRLRVRMHDAEAAGQVLSLQAPQHISFTWDWLDEPLGATSVVAFDAIDHGARTHLTVRHVGLPDRREVELHDGLWQHWLGRLVAAAKALPDRQEVTHP